MNPPLTRCEVLPKQVQDDLVLILFWMEHYAPHKAEQDAVERLVDYFAEPAEEPAYYPELDSQLDELERQAEADEEMADHLDNMQRAREQMDGLRRGMGLDTEAEADAPQVT